MNEREKYKNLPRRQQGENGLSIKKDSGRPVPLGMPAKYHLGGGGGGFLRDYLFGIKHAYLDSGRGTHV